MIAPITAAERAAWQAACNEATPGPWGVEVADVGSGAPEWAAVGPPQAGAHRPAYEQAYADARFLAYARTALPRLLAALTAQAAENALLLAEVRALRDEVAALRVANGQLCEDVATWHAARATRVTDLAALYRAEGDGVPPLPDPDAPEQIGLLP